MSPETLDAAVSFLQEQSSFLYTTLLSSSSIKKKWKVTSVLQKSIEQIIFQHKLILLPNKTLLDTVQPVEQWTLKQPTKNGACACCDDPDEDDDDDDDMMMKKTSTNNPILSNETTSEMTNKATRSSIRGYVDGKMKFAFDPTKFA